MVVSFSLDDYRRFIEAMNNQFVNAHTLGQEQAAQQLDQVIRQVMDYLATVFQEGQQWHDYAVQLQQEIASLRASLRDREQQEVQDRHELQARVAQVSAATEQHIGDVAESAFEAKTKEKNAKFTNSRIG